MIGPWLNGVYHVRRMARWGGWKFVPLCKNCGREMQTSDRFCPNRGQPRQGVDATSPLTGRSGGDVGPEDVKRTELLARYRREGVWFTVYSMTEIEVMLKVGIGRRKRPLNDLYVVMEQMGCSPSAR